MRIATGLMLAAMLGTAIGCGGKIHLSLPGEQKSFIAGTFSAEWIRARNELPGADDAPYIQGKIMVNGAAEPQVDVGYVRVSPAEPTHSDVLGIVIGPSGFPFRSETNRPRCISLFPATAKDPARYEFTKLEPGRYLAIAAFKTGPAAWKWLDVAAGSQTTADFTLNVTTIGGLDVSAPNGSKSVAVVPASEPGKPWPESLISTAASMMELRVDTSETGKTDPTKPLTLKFPRLAPGKYEVWADDLKADVEIKANDTAKVELKKK